MQQELPRIQITALADDLRGLLDRIEAGELEATTAMRYRIQGAVAVLEVVQGRSPKFHSEAD